MPVNLYLTHCSLLFITLISSCFLFYVVAQENAKYVAAGGAADVVVETHSTDHPDMKATRLPAPPPLPPLSNEIHKEEEVLPNYKKVHKSEIDDVNEQYLATPSIDATGNVRNPDEQEAEQKTRENAVREEILSDSVTAESIVASVESEIISNRNEKPLSEVIKSKEENHIETHQTQPTTTGNNAYEEMEEKEQKDAGTTDDVQEGDAGLPDIKEIPTLTATELPFDILEPSASLLDAIIIESTTESLRDPENITVDILENSNEAMQKDEQIIKINDSGGGGAKDQPPAAQDIPQPPPATAAVDLAPEDVHIPNENATALDTTTETPPGNDSDVIVETSTVPSTINLTAEEVPMPVFSEWAQKQMEAAEKQQALEQDGVNTSALKKDTTNGNARQAQLKIRAKNYASPDCGAKIISSNADAINPPALINSHKDEYMLSPCGNRIWFVVELCEAIQAQRIDLANFELFSSSPKNFTVAVSNRFSTREWSNVGRFIAEDKRTVQTFELQPHLFGKFVRVDIHSHYSKEHFCPVSLFRVFGTSEFEAFETENQAHDDLDDFDEDFAAQELALGKNPENNLFKSASDAVFSIMKKAAEVLVKPVNNLNQSLHSSSQSGWCHTRTTGQFSCAACNQTLVERINAVLSCEPRTLASLLGLGHLKEDLRNSQICATRYGLAVLSPTHKSASVSHPLEMDLRRSFFINILPSEYVGALCQLLLEAQLKQTGHLTTNEPVAVSDKDDPGEVPLNLTLNKKQSTNEFEIVGRAEKIPPPQASHNDSEDEPTVTTSEPIPTTEASVSENAQLPRPSVASGEDDELARATTTPQPPPASKEPAPDVNIFNVPEVESAEVGSEWTVGHEASGDQAEATPAPTTTSAPPASVAPSSSTTTTTTTTTTPPPTTTPTPTTAAPPTKADEDPGTWESFETLLTSTVAPQTGNAGFNGGNSIQHKIPSSPQSESVFIRLSNRIKALERNMSLSGQYLEELSRRYKKQVEELQLTLTQQTQTVRSLEQQIRHQTDMEQVYAESNAHLKRELNDLTLQVHACIVVTVVVGVLVMLIFLFGFIYYRKMHRQTLEMLAAKNCKRNECPVVVTEEGPGGKKLNRRKSYEDFSVHQRSITLVGGSEKLRRPSEEASMLITNGFRDTDEAPAKGGQLRQRKLSVCYGVSGGAGGALNNDNGPNPQGTAATNGPVANGNNNNNYYKPQSGKRKGEKHSWPSSGPAMQHAWQRLEELDESMHADEIGPQRSIGLPPHSGKAKRKGQHQQLKRQESAPPREYAVVTPRLNVTAPGEIDCGLNNSGVSYDEKLILDDEDLDNFIPNADLAYNEFMPEGPSGYQIISDDSITTANTPSAEAKKSKSSTTAKKVAVPTVAAKPTTEKKSRRLSSPAFFKSPFSKNLKGKRLTASLASSSSSSTSSNTKLHNNSIPKTNTPHESTSWEWYRLRNKSADSKHLNTSTSATNFTTSGMSPNASVDSSSLSEINFPTDYTQNSFRILEEAILSSGESVAQATKGGGGSSSGGDSSIRSSTSSTTKKKSRSFNKIFRKVF